MDAKQLLDRYGPKELKQVQTDRQLGLARFSSCGGWLFAGGLDGTVRWWSVVEDGLSELPPLAGHGGWVQAIAAGPDRRLFTADSWGKLCAWSISDSDAICIWSTDAAHRGWIRAIAVRPDGQQIATCGIDQVIRLWSATDGAKQIELNGHSEDIFCLAFHPDGRSLVSGDLKGVVKHWDVPSGECLREFDARMLFKLDRLQDVGGARALAFDRDGTMLACGGLVPKVGANVQGSPTILVFDWQTGMKKHTLTLGGDGDGFVYDLHFHRDGFLMAVTSGNPGSGKFLFIRPRDKEPFFVTTKMPNCHSLGVHPDGRRMIVTATNGESNGNGRRLKDGEYLGNWSPVHLWTMPKDNA